MEVRLTPIIWLVEGMFCIWPMSGGWSKIEQQDQHVALLTNLSTYTKLKVGTKVLRPNTSASK